MQKSALEKRGCFGTGNQVGSNAKKLADIIGASVAVGELNLLAALSKQYEMTRAHERFERQK